MNDLLARCTVVHRHLPVVGRPDASPRAEVQRIRSEYTQTVKEAFDAADIEIPYPFRQLTGGVTNWEAPYRAALRPTNEPSP